MGDFMGALDAYLDARDDYYEAERGGWARVIRDERERALATARCALEREVEALHGKKP
jgi:hypothetical protein